MSDNMKLEYYIIRPSGTMVPLIPIDEIPTTIQIPNVKRFLSLSDIEGMKCVNNADPRKQSDVVITSINTDPAERDRFPYASVIATPPYATAGSRTSTANNAHSSRSRHSHDPSRSQYGTEPTYMAKKQSQDVVPQSALLQSVVSRNSHGLHTSSPNSTTNPKNNNPAPDQRSHNQYASDPPRPPTPHHVKQYCSYWLRHGECDYSQQGCLYRHDMPLDLPTLQRLGFRDIPRWYRELHGLESLLSSHVIQNSDHHHNNANADNRGRGRIASSGAKSTKGIGWHGKKRRQHRPVIMPPVPKSPLPPDVSAAITTQGPPRRDLDVTLEPKEHQHQHHQNQHFDASETPGALPTTLPASSLAPTSSTSSSNEESAAPAARDRDRDRNLSPLDRAYPALIPQQHHV